MIYWPWMVLAFVVGVNCGAFFIILIRRSAGMRW